jgi:hypothetical protein
MNFRASASVVNLQVKSLQLFRGLTTIAVVAHNAMFGTNKFFSKVP